MSEKESLESVEPVADKGRRMLLLAGTGAVGAVGVGFAAWPFLASWNPSARARVVGAPVEAYIGDLEPGQLMRLVWRGQTIGIMRRTDEMVDNLSEINDDLRDPESEVADQQPPYAANQHRSIRPEILVLNLHCTHLGCVPEFIPEVGAQPFEQNWKGGFFCPCHKSKFDLAGRVYGGVPAPSNLVVPPYNFADNDHVVIGVHPEGAA
ncbi:MAG: ubiquinol-cytochrome c reductase iron-sulfur subunit [Wenzhouxiangellaceae bacterium]|nr:ubiquinol-cytochrome c reductase iron-sulfur subunit [Wenzhouxiangellaceae bacterium]MBS3745438.1 ubiquinol-cytochrome c reductase iron-sulfur subunit [Wenzhouxiangellaceae bacterium]